MMLRLARARAGGAAARRAPALSLLLLAAAAAAAAPPAHAQGAAGGEDVGPSPSDLVLLFAVSIAAVAGIALYISREAIARKKTPYDRGSYESQRNRDYEKYHSGWGDESAAGRGAGGLDDDLDDDFGGGVLDDDFGGGGAGGGAPDYYGVLGLGRNAGPGEVKQRYRELAKEAHPDRAGGAPGGGDAVRRMALINEAYEVLSDPDRRKRYDLWLGRRGGDNGGDNGGGEP